MKKRNAVNPAVYLVKKFGGIRSASRMIGIACSAIHRWTKTGEVPLKAVSAILIAAHKNGIKLDMNRAFERK